MRTLIKDLALAREAVQLLVSESGSNAKAAAHAKRVTELRVTYTAPLSLRYPTPSQILATLAGVRRVSQGDSSLSRLWWAT